MRPRLLRVSGAPAETPLDPRGITIGRDAGNAIRLEDPIVSGHHVRIEVEDGHPVIIDCESTNGTFLNGKAIARANLKHGDEILVGHTRFHFFVDEGAEVPPSGVRVEDDGENPPLSSETVQLNPRDSAYLRAGFSEDTAALRRLARDMSTLLKLTSEINETVSAVDIQNLLLDRIFQRIPAENGVILLGTSVDQLLGGTPVVRQVSRDVRNTEVSRTIVQKVFTSAESLLSNDLLADKDASDSVRSSKLRSVLCVPLTVNNTGIGVVYLSTTNPAEPFDPQHLELVTAIGGIGAVALEHARYVEWLEIENRQLADKVNLGHDMVGEHEKMKQVYESIALIAPTDSSVLILGESGTGKELAARAVHNNSGRRNGPFVAVNCGAVVETLFASQLFGYVKGAFTGAERDQKGSIEEADGGTLFLDELGDLPLHCQAALLRVLEERKVQRVGSARPIAVDIRLVSATHRILADEIRRGTFRSDLYFRMGLPIELPPLRERLDDIPLLVRFFLQKYKHNSRREIGATPPETIRILQQHSWPGNVRELGRAIYWAVVFGKSDRIRPDDLPPEVRREVPRGTAAVPRLEDALEAHERKIIVRALEETRGNVVEAAGLLDRAPNYLQRRISQLKLRNELDRIRTTPGS